MKPIALWILFFTLCVVPLRLTVAEPVPATEESHRPNILLAIADDWSFGHASAYGCPWVETPNFDRLAREGILFTHAFTPNAKCAPSRATILTGRYSWQLEEAGNHMAVFPPKFGSYVERLAADGYVTGFTGKGWGPGIANDESGKSRLITGKRYASRKAKPPTTKISNIDYAANFEEFLADTSEDQPWVFWYGTTEPHRAYEFKSGVRLGKQLSDIDRVPSYWPDTETVRHDMLDYAIEVEHYDKHLGRILESLEKSGQLDNTLIVATSDHGMPFPRVKGQAYADSNHIPLAIRWGDGIPTPGRVVDDIVNFADLAPTFLDAAGIEKPGPMMQPISGTSLRNILESEQFGIVDEQRDHVLVGKERHDIGRPGDVGYPIRGILQGDWLYLKNYETDRWPAGNPETGYLNCDGGATKTVVLNRRREGVEADSWQMCFGRRPTEEFYHLKTDADCVINLADAPQYADQIQAMRTRMTKQLSQQGDPRMKGKGEIFDRYPSTAGKNVGFYERWMAGEKLNAGWVNASDFEQQPIEDAASKSPGNALQQDALEAIVVIGDKSPAIKNPQPGKLKFPFGIDFNAAGEMVIAEYTGGRVLKRNSDGKLIVIAGRGEQGYGGDGGPAIQATFHDLHNLAIANDGNIYLSDHENHAVRKIDINTGIISSFAGNGKPGFEGDGGPAKDARFHQVMCVTLTPDKSKLLVTDLRNRRIRSIDLSTSVITTVAGNGQKGVPKNGTLATTAPLQDPRAAAVDHQGNLYILERGGNALRVVRPSGQIETVAGTGRKGDTDGDALSAEMAGPKHLAIDQAGNVYIADDNNHCIRKYDPTAKTLTTILGKGEFKLNRPHGVAVHEGWLYVADSWNHRVLKIRLPQ